MTESTPPSKQTAPTIATVPPDTLTQASRVVAGGISWRKTFAAFHHRNYRLFFSGQLTSVIGTWMQQVALNWLVYTLSNSAFTLGWVRFLSAIPVTLFTLLGGALADRFEKRRIVILTESTAMVLAFVLAILVYFRVIKIWQIALLGFLDGITDAFDIPTRQSFVVEMVGKDDLMNAIALNSSLFNGARVFGPALAGVLIGIIGLTGCFFVNSLSYLAIVAAYFAMRLPAAVERFGERKPMWHETAEALRYVRGHRLLRAVISLVTIVSLFGWPYSILLPVFARDVLHTQASGYGYLMAANGVGALFGALTLASLGHSVGRRILFFGGLFGFCIMLAVFALSHVYWLSATALAGSGFFMIIFFATANTTVQTRVPDELRGRVMGIYALAFLGLTPFGSLMAGAIAKATSASFTVSLGAVICLVAGLVSMRLTQPQPNDSVTLPAADR
ncbi:MAG TPA: MFS transporter [Verrucomicrobiae bacterium]|nr:MFS transporter [Verrucomicrobiae bacterium]